METIINGIIKVLEQTLKIDKLLIDQITFLKIQFLIMGFLILLLTLYSVFYICYNSNRIRKIERIIKSQIKGNFTNKQIEEFQKSFWVK